MPRAKPTPKTGPAWAADLTDRERRFVEHYAVSLCGADAARKAGYKERNADRVAHVIRSRPAVAVAISALIAERAGITGAHVLAKLGAIANTNIDDVATVKNGVPTVKDTADLSPDALVAVAGYDVNEKGFVTVKLHDRIRALELLAKILGMRRSPTEGPTINVGVQVNNNHHEAADRIAQRLDAVLQRQQAAALPAPTQAPMLIDIVPVKEPAHV